jgi:guanylate kinase
MVNNPDLSKQNKEGQARLFVISAPSGAGKTTLVRQLLGRNPRVKFSISYTTRSPRMYEQNGDDYFFVSKKEFLAMVETGEFLEHAEVFDNYYGTSSTQVQNQLNAGQHVLLEIDWQGARQIREAWPDCISIFILPPSLLELERRLRTRATDSDKVIQRRLQDSISDIAHWTEFDHVIINDDLNSAIQELEAVIEQNGLNSKATNPERRALIAASGYTGSRFTASSEEE